MSVWSWLSERRRWGAEIKDVPQQQFRRMVEGTMFYRDPAKQKWASGVLWRREHLWNHPIALAGLVVAIVGPIFGLIGKWYGLF